MLKVKKILRRCHMGLLSIWGALWTIRCLFISYPIKTSAINYIRDNPKGIFFILGSGRSGTQLMSSLLGHSGQASVLHEPNFFEDLSVLSEVRRDDRLSYKYLYNFRLVQIYKRWEHYGFGKKYIEVNGTLRYLAPTIRLAIPEARLMLISRDGRGFVRSLMGWPQFYSDGSKGVYGLSPLPEDPYYQKWNTMSRFEKICWSWMDTNEFLMRNIPPDSWIRLEQIVSDYEYFVSKLSNPIGLQIDIETWKKYSSQRSPNSTSQYSFPDWHNWTEDQKQKFILICGCTMNKLGYKL